VRQGSHGRLKIVGRSAPPELVKSLSAVLARLPDFVEPTKAKAVDSMRPAIGSTKSSLTVTAPMGKERLTGIRTTNVLIGDHNKISLYAVYILRFSGGFWTTLGGNRLVALSFG
jgi:hypothetical protein